MSRRRRAADLKQQAAREILERIELDGTRVVAGKVGATTKAQLVWILAPRLPPEGTAHSDE